MRAKEFLGELGPLALAPYAAPASAALGAAARTALPKAIQFGKELYKKAMTPAAKPTTTPAAGPAATTTPSSVIQVPQKVGGGARDTATQTRMQTARTGEPPASTSPQPFKSNRTNEPLDPKQFGKDKPTRDTKREPDPFAKYDADQAARDNKIMGATVGSAAVGAGVPLFTMGGDKAAQRGSDSANQTSATAARTGSKLDSTGRTADPRASQTQSSTAPSAAPKGGAVGTELGQLSGGQFASRADRLDQAKVDAVLGSGKFKAGTAAANTALRDYYKQNPSASRTSTAASTASAPAAAAAAPAASTAAAPAAATTSIPTTPAVSQQRITPSVNPPEGGGADSGGDSAEWGKIVPGKSTNSSGPSSASPAASSSSGPSSGNTVGSSTPGLSWTDSSGNPIRTGPGSSSTPQSTTPGKAADGGPPLSADQKKWLGGADPNDTSILNRMRKAIPDEPAKASPTSSNSSNTSSRSSGDWIEEELNRIIKLSKR